MSCGSSCSSTSVGGCNNNGNCSSDGCNKLNTFNWLTHMSSYEDNTFDVMEVRFKNGRKDFYKNDSGLDIITGDAVVVDVPNGHHIGYVSLKGKLVKIQMKKKGVKNSSEVREIYRKATEADLSTWSELKVKEPIILTRARDLVNELDLEIKVSDIEIQADTKKAILYFTSEQSIDFRKLKEILDAEYNFRFILKNIPYRLEASRIGGIGVCGRELCCSTWLTDFKSVNISAARYQNLSINSVKLAGQCGRLKCCLNFELDAYMDALKHIPKVSKGLLTEVGKAKLQKTDIFRKIMWFELKDQMDWISISTKRVSEILEMNKKGIKPATLAEDIVEAEPIEKTNEDLLRLDKKYGKKKKKSFRKRKPQNR